MPATSSGLASRKLGPDENQYFATTAAGAMSNRWWAPILKLVGMNGSGAVGEAGGRPAAIAARSEGKFFRAVLQEIVFEFDRPVVGERVFNNQRRGEDHPMCHWLKTIEVGGR